MNKQEYYRKLYKKLNKNWVDSISIYKREVLKLVNQNSVFLDIGCGYSNLFEEVAKITPYTYGVDSDASAINKNIYYKNLHVSSAENLPFENEMFDVVVATWVIEHLENPKQVLREVYRVLKKDGKFVFITPNIYNYNVLIARLIPNKFHEFFTARLYSRAKGDTYPTYYRLNSRGSITSIAKDVGFTHSTIVLNGDPTYISFEPLTFIIGYLIELVLDLWMFKFMKVHIIAILEK